MAWQPGYVKRPWSTTLHGNWHGLERKTVREAPAGTRCNCGARHPYAAAHAVRCPVYLWWAAQFTPRDVKPA